MGRMTMDGDLALLLADFADSFQGGIARWTGSSLTVCSGFPCGVTLSGGHIGIPSTGPEALTGRIDGVVLGEGRIVDLSQPIEIVDRMVVEGLTFRAETLFDLVSRQPGSVTVAFDHDVFVRTLGREDWSVTASAGEDVIRPSALLRLAGNDTIRGGAGADFLSGGRGADRLEGWSGDDVLGGGGGADRLIGGAGTDRLAGGSGSDRMAGGIGADVLRGGAGSDDLAGQRGPTCSPAGPGTTGSTAARGATG